MLDIKHLRENLSSVEARLKTRGAGGVDLSGFKALDEKRRNLLREAEALKSRRNTVSDEIGRLKRDGAETAPLMADMREVAARIKDLDTEVTECDRELGEFLLLVPNIPHGTVPVGRDETDNAVVRTWGGP